jgi:trehalose utilization protein
MINVTVWNEFLHETRIPEITAIYPKGIHNAIADHLRENPMLNVRTATLREPAHGLTDEVLNGTDVLMWWGHMAHEEVSDAVAEKVYQRVMQGMGFIALHSAHASKPFVKLCGTECCNLSWREAGEKERLWRVSTSHPILNGIEGDYFEIPHEEMYGEPFCIPQPDELLLISWFEGGEVFRSAFTLKRGAGKVFYFRPGHEAFPVYHQAEVQKILENAVIWAAPAYKPYPARENFEPLEPLKSTAPGIHDML